MSFTEDNYLVVRNAIDSKFANFLYQYMLLQRNIAKFKFEFLISKMDGEGDN